QYCDWYLELSKPVLWDAAQGSASVAEGRTPEATESAHERRQRGTRRTLVRVLETALRLAHPFMPFITEEIWQRIAPLAGKIGAEMDIAPGKALDVLLRKASAEDQRRLSENEASLKKLAKLESIRVLSDADEAPLAATALVGELEVLVPMAGLIDKDAELARVDKEIARLRGEVKRIGGKRANEGFVAKAPAAVIDKERAKLEEAEKALTQLSEQRAHIANL